MRKITFLLSFFTIILLGTSGYSQTAGTALNFNGANGAVTIGPAIAPTTDITVAAWIKPSASGAMTIIGGHEAAASSTNKTSFGVNASGNVEFSVYNTGNSTWKSIAGTTTLTAGTWYHVAAVYVHGSSKSTRRVQIYVNGSKEGDEKTGVNPRASSNFTRIGASWDSGASPAAVGKYFNGEIDDLVVLNTGIADEAGIQALMVNAAIDDQFNNLVAHYNFNDGVSDNTATTVTDTSGNHSGTTTGTSWVTSGAFTNPAAPTFTTDPSVDNITQSDFKLNVQLSGAGQLYYIVEPTVGGNPPTSASDVFNNGTSVTTDGTLQDFTISGNGLDTSVENTIYFVAQDGASPANKQWLFTSLVVSPFVSGSGPNFDSNADAPSLSHVDLTTDTAATFTLNATLDGEGTVYYVIVPTSATPPSDDNVIAGKSDDNTELDASYKGSIDFLTGDLSQSYSLPAPVDLSAGDYSIYFIPTSRTDESMRGTLEVLDIVAPAAPTFTNNGTPSFTSSDLSDLAIAEFDISVELAVQGKVYYLIAATAPSVTEVVEAPDSDYAGTLTFGGTPGPQVITKDTSNPLDISGGDYSVYFVTQHVDGIVNSDVTKLKFPSAPDFVSNTPSLIDVDLTDTSNATFRLNVQVDGLGTVYYVVVSNVASVTPPTATNVFALTDGDGNQPTSSGTFAFADDSDPNTNDLYPQVSSLLNFDLTADGHTIYFVTEDSSGTLQQTEVTTLKIEAPSAPEFVTDAPYISDVAGLETAEGSFKMHAGIDLLGEVYVAIIPSSSPEPSVAQLINGTDGNGDAAQVAGSFKFTSSLDFQSIEVGAGEGTPSEGGPINLIEEHTIYFVAQDTGITAPLAQAEVTALKIENTASVDDTFVSKGITLYPNPVSSSLSINLSAGLTINAAQVYDRVGREVISLQGNFNKVDVSALSQGIYFVKFTTNQGVGVKKILKK